MNPLGVFHCALLLLGPVFPYLARAEDDTLVAVSSPNASVVRLAEIEVTITGTAALTLAPAESSQESLQPQTVMNIDTIPNSIAPSAVSTEF